MVKGKGPTITRLRHFCALSALSHALDPDKRIRLCCPQITVLRRYGAESERGFQCQRSGTCGAWCDLRATLLAEGVGGRDQEIDAFLRTFCAAPRPGSGSKHAQDVAGNDLTVVVWRRKSAPFSTSGRRYLRDTLRLKSRVFAGRGWGRATPAPAHIDLYSTARLRSKSLSRRGTPTADQKLLMPLTKKMC